MGTNGGAITLEKVVDLETEITQDNAAGPNMAYVTNAKVMGALKKLRAVAPLHWRRQLSLQRRPDRHRPRPNPADPERLSHRRYQRRAQQPDKGTSSSVCSALVAGDFSQAMLGFYGNGLEITVGTDSDDFSKALTSVRGIVSFDVAVRQATASVPSKTSPPPDKGRGPATAPYFHENSLHP